MERAHRAPPAIRHVPNVLSCLRLVAAVAFPLVSATWRLPLVLFAGLSDWLDGAIARRFGATSWVGGLLDGVSDKAFVITALCTLSGDGALRWFDVALLLARDVSVASGVTVSALRGDRDAFRHMDSRWFGKLTTVVIFVLLVVLLAAPEAGVTQRGLLWLGEVLSVVAGFDYYFARRERIMGSVEP